MPVAIALAVLAGGAAWYGDVAGLLLEKNTVAQPLSTVADLPVATVKSIEPASATAADAPVQTTSAALWAEYLKNPSGHPVIPDISYAGYQYGEVPLPTPAVIANVRDFGATGNGTTDDTAAVRAAIASATAKGGGVILLPAGTYSLSDVIRLDSSNLVLRGEGEGKTVICFTRSLGELRPHRGQTWSWTGGLVWAGLPTDEDGPGLSPLWKPVSYAWVSETADAGATDLRVDPIGAEALASSSGKSIILVYEGDLSLPQLMAGHPAFADYPWAAWDQTAKGGYVWRWATSVTRIEGNHVQIKQPLRLPITSAMKVKVLPSSSDADGIGIKHLTIRMPEHPDSKHLEQPGYNGIFFEAVLHGWIRQVTIENADFGVILSYSSHCTMTALSLTGGPAHHGISCRDQSHDNLIDRFEIICKAYHGISTQDGSSGNVFSRGKMIHGTFDSHRGMPFDTVRTEIDIVNDGRPGGADTAGPYSGRRMVNWNIRIDPNSQQNLAKRGRFLMECDIYPMGALVGITGAEIMRMKPEKPDAPPSRFMPYGAKGVRVADLGLTPSPENLYEAQRKARLQRSAVAPGHRQNFLFRIMRFDTATMRCLPSTQSFGSVETPTWN